jgi:hypothetical protein
MVLQIDGLSGRQTDPAAHVVVDKEAKPQHPARTKSAMMRQYKPLGPDEMRACAQQYLSFLKGLTNEAKLERFQVAQTPVDKFGGGRGSSSAKIAFIAEIDGKATACSIACDPTAIDTAPYNGKIENQLCTAFSDSSIAIIRGNGAEGQGT